MHAEYSVSVHDVAPATWHACQRLLALADHLGAPVTLLVVPHYHAGRRADADAGFVAALRQRAARGDEVVLHGYSHLDRGASPRSPVEWLQRRVVTAGEGEFAALDLQTASALIERGQSLLAAIGVPPAGFVAPAWLMNGATLEALGRSGLRYACSRDELIELATGRRVAAPSLVYSVRSAWRRAVSRRWNAARLDGLRAAPHVRVALHPADSEHASVLADWQRLLARLAGTRRAVLETRWLD
jgi:predicted deacetylase